MLSGVGDGVGGGGGMGEPDRSATLRPVFISSSHQAILVLIEDPVAAAAVLARRASPEEQRITPVRYITHTHTQYH